MSRLVHFLFLVICCLAQSCVNDKEVEGNSLGVGDPLPYFIVTMNNGEIISTSSLKGKTGVIVFFNTGCPDCRKELPVIQQLWEKFKDNENIVIAPIAREESEEEILQYWNDNHLTLPFSPQEDREVYSLFAPSIIPRIYIFDSKGIITAAYGDTDMPNLATLEEDIATASRSIKKSLQ